MARMPCRFQTPGGHRWMGSRRESFGWTSPTMTCQAQSQQDLMEVCPALCPMLMLDGPHRAQCYGHAAGHHRRIQGACLFSDSSLALIRARPSLTAAGQDL